MPGKIIELLEVVDIKHNHPNRFVFPFRSAQLSFKRFFHISPVEKAGKRVADRLLTKSFLQFRV
ncbi:hypothetical protein SDC9_207493 [bioreactor metagenome]|uniref:Uncharacterized protein n=1 Tax=bioreactor metagenome TaxID=1076179 RepID=A0A645J827_9ZZZZ